MGGGDSSITTSELLTGDVKIDADALKNVLLVQANGVDMDTIMNYIDYFDTDSPNQDPSLDGKTYTIKVQYRDAAELAEVIKTQYVDRIKTAQTRQQASNPQAEQMKMMQQLLGGRGRGGGGGGKKTVEQSEPKLFVAGAPPLRHVYETSPTKSIFKCGHTNEP